MTMQNLTHRPLQDGDIETICGFPSSLEEVSFMFRDPAFPLPPDRLRAQLQARESPTVVLADGAVAGMASLYDCRKGERCSVGNVIVDPNRRGRGIARHLIEIMADIAASQYGAEQITLVCFNRNIGGLLLYTKLGFEPYAIEARQDPGGGPAAAIRMRRALPLT